ncbi:hypothetical protein JCM10213_003303 [Rhodosporidiobolus nylandii]
MPVPPLPNELISLIFEHLYRLLCVDPSRTALSHPEAAPFVFHRISLVSRIWYRLALPFLVRHVDASVYGTDGLDGYLERNGLWDEVRSLHCRGDKLASQMAIIEAHAQTLVRIDIARSAPVCTFFPDALAVVLPSLRELRIDFPSRCTVGSPGQGQLLRFLVPVSRRAPLLEILHVTCRDRALGAQTNRPYDFGKAGFRCLKSLTIKNLHARADYIVQGVAPFLVGLSSDSLTSLDLEIFLADQGHSAFSTLFPFALPRLTCLRCDGAKILCNDPTFFDNFPSLQHAALSLRIPSTNAVLPPHPPLRGLTVYHLPVDSLDALAEQLCSLPPLHQARLRHVALHPKQPRLDQLEGAKLTMLRLSAWATANGVTLSGADHVLSLCTPNEVFWTLPRLAVWSSAVGELGPPSTDSASESSDDEPRQSEDSETEDDWDAEDWPLFRKRWSKEKRLRYDLDNVPDLSIGEASQRFEMARQGAIEAMRTFMREQQWEQQIKALERLEAAKAGAVEPLRTVKREEPERGRARYCTIA